MEDYIKKLQHFKRGSHGRGQTFKKILLVAAVAVVVGVAGLIILVAVALDWLISRGDEVKQAGQNVVQQAQLPSPSTLDLQSYITDNQANIGQLEQIYNSLPGHLQGLWLNQFEAQLDDLRSQAGIPDETIQALTDLYNSLKQG